MKIFSVVKTIITNFLQLLSNKPFTESINISNIVININNYNNEKIEGSNKGN